MRQAILRWVLYTAAILVVGPLAAALVAPLHTADGGASASALVSTTPVMGIVVTVAAAGLALLTGILTTRLVGSMRAGMVATGLVLVWIAFQTAQIDDLVRAQRSAGPLWLLAGEGFLIGGLLLGIAVVIVLLSGQPGGDDDAEHAPHIVRSSSGGSTGRPAPAVPVSARLFGEHPAMSLMAIGVGTVAGGAAAFILAVSPLKGQTIAAAIAGAVAAAAAAKLIEQRSPLPLLVVPCVILAVLGPMIGAVLVGGGEGAVRTIYRGGLFPLAHVAPLDWLAGAFLGAPLGASWAASSVEKHGAVRPA